MSCQYKVKPLPHQFCQKCSWNGCYPWNKNPLLLCSEMGGQNPSILVWENNILTHCLSYKLVDLDMWMAHLQDLKREADSNEEIRHRAMDGDAYSSDLLPAEYVEAKTRHQNLSMKVRYETEHRLGAYQEFRYNIENLKETEFCCEDMKEAWSDGTIVFNEESGKVDITKANCYPEDSWLDYYPINYCPFCGAKIDLIETKRTEFLKKTEKHEVTSEVWEPSPS